MPGLRFHAMLALTADCILVHGGRHFKGKPSDNVNGLLYACLIDNGTPTWYNVPFAKKFIPRFGHTMVFNGSSLFLVGGFSSQTDKCICEPQKLSIKEL